MKEDQSRPQMGKPWRLVSVEEARKLDRWIIDEVVTITNLPVCAAYPSGIAVVLGCASERYLEEGEWEARNLANATLMTACPDLLEACCEMRDVLALAASISPKRSALRRALKKVDTAIAKANARPHAD